MDQRYILTDPDKAGLLYPSDLSNGYSSLRCARSGLFEKKAAIEKKYPQFKTKVKIARNYP
jgi:hypothetical protein